MIKLLKSIFTRVGVPEIKKGKVAKKGVLSGIIVYISLMVAKNTAIEMDLPPDEVAAAVGCLLGGLVNWLKHKTT